MSNYYNKTFFKLLHVSLWKLMGAKLLPSGAYPIRIITRFRLGKTTRYWPFLPIPAIKSSGALEAKDASIGIVIPGGIKLSLPFSHHKYPKADWWFGISPVGFGIIAMIANFVVTLVISSRTPAPSKDIQELVANIRKP